ncbi:hypothetical protein COO60DRAFT_1487391 [Scenedesmus sp. NREL 46B-D3]|nr:hypothetical protein COO60DRAFT_1487391 [Scenedesmus sp. NREL 46B-D3]
MDAASRRYADIVLQAADKQHTITAAELAKHPRSLLSKLATADGASSSNSSSSSCAQVLQLDKMPNSPLAEWPEFAAPILSSLYRSGHIDVELLDLALKQALDGTDSPGPAYQAFVAQLMRLLDYLQLQDATQPNSYSSISKWLPDADIVPVRRVRVLSLIYHCCAAAAVQAMLDYKPHTHGLICSSGFDRPKSMAFLVTHGKSMLQPSLCVHVMSSKAGDLAAEGLRAANDRQVFQDSNITVITHKKKIQESWVLAEPVLPPKHPCTRVQDLKPHAVGVADGVLGDALVEALTAAVDGTGLHAGFTWAVWPSMVKTAPFWVLWW